MLSICVLNLTPGMNAVQSARQVFGHYIAVVKQALNRTASFEAGKAADQLLAAVQSTEDTGQSGGKRLTIVQLGLPALSTLLSPYHGHSMSDAGLSSPAVCMPCTMAPSAQRAAAFFKQAAPASLQANFLSACWLHCICE